MNKIKNKQKEEENKIQISGEAKTLFCPAPGCGKLLYFDRESGFHKCSRCGRYWKYIGKKLVITSPQKPPKERRIKKIK